MSKNINIADIGAEGGLDYLFEPIVKFHESNIYLFEPNQEEFKKLKKKYLGDKLVKIFDFAISNNSSKKNFYNYRTCSSLKFRDLFKENKIKKTTVQTETIDNLVKNKTIEIPDIVKIDVEGSENNVLKGMKKSLKRGIICLKTEFSFQGDEKNDFEGNGFSSINKTMLENNFVLVGLCHYYTYLSHVWGGDLLYLKNPEDHIFKNNKEKYIKLLNICYVLNRISFVKNSYEKNKKIFNVKEKKVIERYFNDYFWLGKKSFYFPKLSRLFFLISLFFMGPNYTCKSAPKVNELNGLKRAYVKSFSKNKLL